MAKARRLATSTVPTHGEADSALRRDSGTILAPGPFWRPEPEKHPGQWAVPTMSWMYTEESPRRFMGEKLLELDAGVWTWRKGAVKPGDNEKDPMKASSEGRIAA